MCACYIFADTPDGFSISMSDAFDITETVDFTVSAVKN
jgi:hypothetical protein